MRVGIALAGLLLLTTEVIAVPADTVYRNGFVYTVDAQDSVQQALAIRGGRIVYASGPFAAH